MKSKARYCSQGIQEPGTENSNQSCTQFDRKTQREALNLLTGVKLTLGDIYPEDKTYAIDKIIKQEPEAGTEVEEGTPVKIFWRIIIRTRRKLIVQYSLRIPIIMGIL